MYEEDELEEREPRMSMDEGEGDEMMEPEEHDFGLDEEDPDHDG